MPRKHLIASGINKKQQLQAKLWQKAAREIKAAVKVGGQNPEANPRLKAAIDRALQINLSRDSINKNIAGANKDADSLTQLEYECYAPNGIQIIVNALSDNANRTNSSLRGYLAKLHGEIAKPNSVKIFFDNQGSIILEKQPTQTKDNIEELILDNNIDGYVDCLEYEDSFEVLTTPDNNFYLIKDLFIANGFKVFDSSIKLIAQNKVTKLDDEAKMRLEKFIDSCDNDDDIQTVVTNFEEN